MTEADILLDMMPIWPYLILLFEMVVFFAYSARRMLSTLHMLQQNSYRNERFYNWMKTPANYRQQLLRRDWFMIIPDVVWCIALFFFFYNGGNDMDSIMMAYNIFIVTSLSLNLLGAVVVLILTLTYRRPPQKKPLVFTARAKRIYAVSLVLSALGIFLIFEFVGLGATIWAMVFVHLSCYVMLLANKMLAPVERAISNRFLNDAKRIVSEMPSLKVIGVTGSYGKTSCKMALGRVLTEDFNTLVTPASYNTPMGVTITVRNMLKPSHQVFVTEMGAKQTGDIAELCDLVKPSIGVLTAIGPQHLETFKTIENIADTKFELIRALPADGLAVLNIDNQYIRERLHTAPCRVVTFALNDDTADYRAENIAFTAQGMSFDIITAAGERQAVQTQLLGKHNIYNLLAAAAVACELGMTLQSVARAVARMPQVQYRLEMHHTAGGVHVINDGFNSNPEGAQAAIDVLAAMPGGRKIMITPGMIELGERQYEENKKFASAAAKVCDYIILVAEVNAKALEDGLKEAGYPQEKYFMVPTLSQANALLARLVQAGDYVIYENDLPDTYNAK